MAEKKSRKLVHDSDRKKVSKKTIIISSVILGLLTITGIVLGILWGVGVFDKKEEKYTYFNDLAHLKLNTVEIANKIEDKEHVFLFVYDNEELDAKEGENDTEFNEEYEEVVKQIVELANTIKDRNEALEGKVATDLYYLYLVDTSIAGNETIYENSSFGSITKDEDPAITYFHQGQNFNEIPESLDEFMPEGLTRNDYTITYKGTNKLQLISCIRSVKEFVNELSV